MSTILNGIYQNAVFTEAQINAGENIDRELVIVSDFQTNGVLGTDANKWDYLIGYEYQTGTASGCIRRNLATMEGLSSTMAWPLSGASRVFIDQYVPYEWITGSVDWSVQKALEDLDAGLSYVNNNLSVFVNNETEFINALNSGRNIIICGQKFALTGAAQYNLPIQTPVEVYGEPITFNPAVSLIFNCVVGPQGVINFYNDVYLAKNIPIIAAALPCELKFRNIYNSFQMSLGVNTIIVYERLRDAITFTGPGTVIKLFWDNTVNESELGMKHLKDSLIDGSIVSALDDGTKATITSGVSTIVLGSTTNTNALGDYNAISGGFTNLITSSGASVIAGGQQNIISSTGANQVIGGGVGNLIESPDAAIMSGKYNAIIDGPTYSSSGAVITGGGYNFINGSASPFIGGGQGNAILDGNGSSTSASSSIVGGIYNIIDAGNSGVFIGGGQNNMVGAELLAQGVNDGSTTNIVVGNPGTLSGAITNGTKIRFTKNIATIGTTTGRPIIVDGVIATPDLVYYVVASTPTTFQLSYTSGGTPLEIQIDSTFLPSSTSTSTYEISSIGGLPSGDSAIISGEYNTIKHGFSSLIGMGSHNFIGTGFNTILNGSSNRITESGSQATYNTIIHGVGNVINGSYSNFIGFGNSNTIGTSATSIVFNAILGGEGNYLEGNANTIINGSYAKIMNNSLTVNGGLVNVCDNIILSSATTGSGAAVQLTTPQTCNIIATTTGIIGAGFGHKILGTSTGNSEGSGIFSGQMNSIDGACESVITGGRDNKIGASANIPVTVNVANNTLEFSGDYYIDGRLKNFDIVTFTGGSVPSGGNLKTGIAFYVVNTSTNSVAGQIVTCQLQEISNSVLKNSGTVITLNANDVSVTTMVVGSGTGTQGISVSGQNNIAYGAGSVIASGAYNNITRNASLAAIVGGIYNTIVYHGAESAIIGGEYGIIELGNSNIITSSNCSMIDATNGVTAFNLNSIIGSENCTTTNGNFTTIIGSQNCHHYPLDDTGSSSYTAIINSLGSHTYNAVGNSHIMGAAGGILEVAASSHIYGGGTSIISSLASDGFTGNCTVDTILNGSYPLIHRSQFSTIMNGDSPQIFGYSNHSTIINGAGNRVNYSEYSIVHNGQANSISGYNFTNYISPTSQPYTAPNGGNSTILNGNGNHIFNGSVYGSILNGTSNTIDSSSHVLIDGIGNTVTTSIGVTILSSNTVSITNGDNIVVLGSNAIAIPTYQDNTTYVDNLHVWGTIFSDNPIGNPFVSIGNNLDVIGNITATGTKSFRIPHPVPEKTATKVLVHNCIESPTAGENLYSFKVTATTTNETVTVTLPDYWILLNINPRVFVQSIGSFARGYGSIDMNTGILSVVCELVGDYDVLVLGTRNDPAAQTWGGVEQDINVLNQTKVNSNQPVLTTNKAKTTKKRK